MTPLMFLINVLIIDTGVDVSNKALAPYVREHVADTHGHGTGVTTAVLYGDLNKPDVPCPLVVIDVCSLYKSGIPSCLAKAAKKHYDFVNISAGGEGSNKNEMFQLLQVMKKGTQVIAAAGNEGNNLLKVPYYPASYYYMGLPMIMVGNGTSIHDRAVSSNYSKDVVWIDGRNVLLYNHLGQKTIMRGTSMSAALYTHKLIQKKCGL